LFVGTNWDRQQLMILPAARWLLITHELHHRLAVALLVQQQHGGLEVDHLRHGTHLCVPLAAGGGPPERHRLQRRRCCLVRRHRGQPVLPTLRQHSKLAV
jgi:hypothetical protein